jgi:hypothetical protein
MVLKTEQLQVLINAPGEVYNSSRFDWTGQIEQVTYKNKHTFCTNETLDASLKSTRGIGMCNEFGISTPIGYDDCKVGEFFPKIGIGLLEKENDLPYHFFKPYKVVPGHFEVKQIGDSDLVITSSISNCRGYGYILEKHFEVSGNILFIKYKLTNTGSKAIETEEYCHNFININNLSVNADYKLKFPIKINTGNFIEEVNPNYCVEINNNQLSWKSTPESDFFYTDLNAGHNKINTWSIENTKAGVGVREFVNCVPAQCNVWGKSHVISPEIFINIKLNPRETMQWERKYEFYSL